MRRDLGDFQTPPALVAAVLRTLGPIGTRWPRVLEPSCGRGHFLAGLLSDLDPPREVVGVEIQQGYAAIAEESGARVVRASLFDLDLRRDLSWRGRGPLLVIGNPPWVTNAALGSMESDNLPRKRNVKGLAGLEARTGASNFDIAEAFWLKLIEELADQEPTIALLCKTSVARGVLQHLDRTGVAAKASVHRIDAPAWFGASVDACLFRLALGGGRRLERIPVFGSLEDAEPEAEWGFARGRLVSDLRAYVSFAFADGDSPLEWRQGVKHDAASVMELASDGAGGLVNKLGEAVDVEPEHVYPLLKGTDLGRPGAGPPARSVIVTQRSLGDDTRRLEHDAPRLWTYLGAHAELFARRRSSIYRGRAPYAIFGIGPYSFAPYKVAVSGLHKEPRFRAVGPEEGRPVMLDDTCYFLPCDSAQEAAVLASLLNDPIALALIRALGFRDAKRPITKALLRRIDLRAIRGRIDPRALADRVAGVIRSLGTARPAVAAGGGLTPGAGGPETLGAPKTPLGPNELEEPSWRLPPSTTIPAR